MANNVTNGQGANGIEGNPALTINEGNNLTPAGPAPENGQAAPENSQAAPQNGQAAPAPAQMAGHEQAEPAPAHPMPEPLLAQGLAPEPALGGGDAPEAAQEAAPEVAPEAAPGVAPMPIADDDTEDSPLKGSLKGLELVLLPGDEEHA